MTVHELIKLLETFDGDAVVSLEVEGFYDEESGALEVTDHKARKWVTIHENFETTQGTL